MGNTRSLTPSQEPDYWWPSENSNTTQQTMEESPMNKENSTIIMQNSHDDFEQKREKRKQILATKKVEMQSLRSDLERFMKENRELQAQILKLQLHGPSGKCDQCVQCNGGQCVNNAMVDKLIEENAELKIINETLQKEMEEVKSKNRELNITMSEIQVELQRMNTELLAIETERQEYQNHIKALKDVIKLTKEMVQIRQDQLNHLNAQMKTVEEMFASKEMKIMADELKEEYERQLRNIRNLRTLYEVRQRVDRWEREQLEVTLAEHKALVEVEKTKVAKHEATIEDQQQDISNKYDKIANLESNLGLSNAECRDLKQEINAINQVFSQILSSFNNSQNLDFDKLIKDLQDNHDLLAKIIVNEKSAEISASQTKVLLDLINQSDDGANQSTIDNTEDVTQAQEIINVSNSKKSIVLQTILEEAEPCISAQQLNSAEQIVENLPKVWKVLIELLSQQNPPCAISEGNSSTEISCYKSIQTPNGPKLVLSVSQTFIRLKDLILEKKSLEKEMGRLKNLNGHLEERLQEQEKRLHLVSGEVTKTWHVVGKMQKQHEQLHTQERILRYELAHKRKMLTELKEELEYCRDKWVQAREKNNETEMQWKQLRSEFASRKVISENYSAESGYSDDKSSSDEDIRSEKEDDVSVETHETEDLQYVETDIPQAITNSSVSAAPRPVIKLVTVESNNQENGIPNMTVEVPTANCSEFNLQTEIGRKESVKDSNTCKEKGSFNIRDCDLLSEQSAGESIPKPSLEDILRRREERLQRMEEQCKSLVSKVSKTNVRSNEISDKLDSLHEIYGDPSETASSSKEESNSESQNVTEPTVD